MRPAGRLPGIGVGLCHEFRWRSKWKEAIQEAVSDNRDKRAFSRGRWAIERERCRIAEPAPPRAPTEERAFGAILPNVLAQLGLEDDLWRERLRDEWVGTVGPSVGAHTRPGKYRDGYLTVFVDSSVWLNELLRFGQAPLLAKLQARYGANKIRDLRLQLDPD
jgi:predicted nucleic acid-binding Zn ribbon protein